MVNALVGSTTRAIATARGVEKTFNNGSYGPGRLFAAPATNERCQRGTSISHAQFFTALADYEQ
jgi:hypothetical protein